MRAAGTALTLAELQDEAAAVYLIAPVTIEDSDGNVHNVTAVEADATGVHLTVDIEVPEPDCEPECDHDISEDQADDLLSFVQGVASTEGADGDAARALLKRLRLEA